MTARIASADSAPNIPTVAADLSHFNHSHPVVSSLGTGLRWALDLTRERTGLLLGRPNSRRSAIFWHPGDPGALKGSLHFFDRFDRHVAAGFKLRDRRWRQPRFARQVADAPSQGDPRHLDLYSVDHI